MSCFPRELPHQPRRRRNGSLTVWSDHRGWFVDHLSESENSGGIMAGPLATEEQARREAICLALHLNADFR